MHQNRIRGTLGGTGAVEDSTEVTSVKNGIAVSITDVMFVDPGITMQLTVLKGNAVKILTKGINQTREEIQGNSVNMVISTKTNKSCNFRKAANTVFREL